MSCDFAVWSSKKKLTDKQAGDVYRRLCESAAVSELPPEPAIELFYKELIAVHPEIDSLSDDKVDQSVWSNVIEHTPTHVLVNCVWSKAKEVEDLIDRLARKHNLAVYDPQSDRIQYPDGRSPFYKRHPKLAPYVLVGWIILFIIGAHLFMTTLRRLLG
jgi:hypothetical protein